MMDRGSHICRPIRTCINWLEFKPLNQKSQAGMVGYHLIGRVNQLGVRDIKISDVDFEGPYNIDSTVIPASKAAVYVIICSKDSKYYVKDVGESGEAGIRLSNHDRRSCWKDNCSGSLSVYLCYMPSSEGYDAASRRKLEKVIREQYNPPCGKI
jgi:hypothetical protein